MSEPIKTEFTWEDINDPYIVNPCDYCGALNSWPTCDDGATSSACNHCAFNILCYLLKDGIEKHMKEK